MLLVHTFELCGHSWVFLFWLSLHYSSVFCIVEILVFCFLYVLVVCALNYWDVVYTLFASPFSSLCVHVLPSVSGFCLACLTAEPIRLKLTFTWLRWQQWWHQLWAEGLLAFQLNSFKLVFRDAYIHVQPPAGCTQAVQVFGLCIGIILLTQSFMLPLPSLSVRPFAKSNVMAALV